MNQSELSKAGCRVFELMEFDENEQLVDEIRKHPFGLFLIYLTGSFITVAIFTALVIVPSALRRDPLGLGIDFRSLQLIAALLGSVLSILAIIMTALGAYLYKSNAVLITSEKIVQMLYRNIFDRKISQLSIGDVQDVTVYQPSLFSRLFNFGTIVVETAGEQQNYTFTYAPKPYEHAKKIVGSHEHSVDLHGN